MITFGPRVELARYCVTEGERVLYGQRVDGFVHVFDIPTDEESTNRVYLVERSVESQAALDALLADYVATSRRHDRPAMAVGVIDADGFGAG